MEERKKHFNVGEVKTKTLVFMLRHDSPVKESDITEFLKSEYSQFDRATVNRHLRDLEKLKCVTKVIPAQKSRFNYWDIEFKNLKNIIREYPNINMMVYTKAKHIIINTNFPGIGQRHYKKYFIYISLFSSLFDTFLNNEFESMCTRAFELWNIENIVLSPNARRQNTYDRICNHFYENDFLLGKGSQDAKTFVNCLNEHIKNVNDAFFQEPAYGEKYAAVQKFQSNVDKLDTFYEEWYEKCKKEKGD